MIKWWFIAFVLLIFIELITVNLVTVWFALGAAAAVIATIFTDSLIIQLFVFVVVSLISLVITKPIINKFKVTKITPTNLDRVVGCSGEVTEKILKDKNGQVKVLGSLWTASSDKKIDIGKKIRVLKIDGVKLIVEEEI